MTTNRNRGTLTAGRNQMVACRCCGTRTHSSIDGNLDVALCRICLTSADYENEHSDNDGHEGGVIGAAILIVELT